MNLQELIIRHRELAKKVVFHTASPVEMQELESIRQKLDEMDQVEADAFAKKYGSVTGHFGGLA